jgi:cytochrome c-type biogenesis protein
MPALQRIHEDYVDRGLQVVGVSIDGTYSKDAIARFVARHGITFPILHDAGQSVVTAFRTVGVPETFLIDQDGTIAARFVGEFDPTAESVRASIEALLAAPPAA